MTGVGDANLPPPPLPHPLTMLSSFSFYSWLAFWCLYHVCGVGSLNSSLPLSPWLEEPVVSTLPGLQHLGVWPLICSEPLGQEQLFWSKTKASVAEERAWKTGFRLLPGPGGCGFRLEPTQRVRPSLSGGGWAEQSGPCSRKGATAVSTEAETHFS